MIQIRLSHPFPHPQPSLFPPPQQQSKIKRSRQLLFPPKQDEPQDPPQPVAAKSLMLNPPNFSYTVSYGTEENVLQFLKNKFFLLLRYKNGFAIVKVIITIKVQNNDIESQRTQEDEDGICNDRRAG